MLGRLKSISLFSTIVITCSSQLAVANYTVTTISPNNHTAFTTPHINNAGQAFWAGADENMVINSLLYDGASITTINTMGLPIALSEQGGAYWLGFADFNYTINGNTSIISLPGAEYPFPEFSLVNNAGQMAWTEYSNNVNNARFWDGLNTHTPFSKDVFMPQINNHGHVLAAALSSPTLELLLWDGTNVTTYAYPEYSSATWIHLDDNGRIYFFAFDPAWSTFELNMVDNNGLHTIAAHDYFPGQIKGNAAGQLAWTKTVNPADYFNRSYDVYLWDGSSVTLLATDTKSRGTIATPGFINQNGGTGFAINEQGHVAWSDFTVNPEGTANVLNIYLKDESGTQTIYSGIGVDGVYNVNMNDNGFVAWHSSSNSYNEAMINAWDGTTTHRFPSMMSWNLERTWMQWLNENGDIAWLYRDPANGLISVKYGAYPPPNTPPTADAGAALSTYTGNTITLDGSASSDADGDALTYSWSIHTAPAGSLAQLSDTTSSQPTFTADTDGGYVFSLIVNDGLIDSAAAIVSLTVVTPEAAALETTTTVATTVEALDTTSLSGKNNGSTLNNMFDNVVTTLIADGDHAGAIDYLNDAVLPKMDGCELRGSADMPGSTYTKDWITDCEIQKPIYDEVNALIGILRAQL